MLCGPPAISSASFPDQSLLFHFLFFYFPPGWLIPRLIFALFRVSSVSIIPTVILRYIENGRLPSREASQSPNMTLFQLYYRVYYTNGTTATGKILEIADFRHFTQPHINFNFCATRRSASKTQEISEIMKINRNKNGDTLAK